jgi:hypothetical protein
MSAIDASRARFPVALAVPTAGATLRTLPLIADHG